LAALGFQSLGDLWDMLVGALLRQEDFKGDSLGFGLFFS